MEEHSHVRYAVRLPQTAQWVGSRQFDREQGSHAALTDFEHARVFTRKGDAIMAARPAAGEVIPVKVSAVW